MAYTAEEGRLQLLEDVARAVGQLSVAVASLGEAYELVDEQLGDRLEETLFRPAQLAYGRASRTYTEFASRHRLAAPELRALSSGQHESDPRTYLERASDAVEQADLILSELQDSLLPVEVGDRELRDALAEVRSLIGDLPARGAELARSVGR
jgi:hypothetical protein